MSITLNSLVNLNDTFNLSSNPTATKTIYLDFDGYYSTKSVWENGANLQLGGFYPIINDIARTEIQRIWARVAEDFAPFNINVTTKEPNSEDLKNTGGSDDRWGIRAAFTNNINLLTGSAIKNAGGGGTAYYNSFNWSTDEVALIFNRGAYTAAETASHEIGHSLGLGHDGAGTNTEYYEGHGTGSISWAAIMGASWLGSSENVTQWSKGEYAGANNTQDDLSVITSNNGFTYREDDHQNTFASATNLTGTTFSAFGIIERNTDIDMFKFTSLGGLVDINIDNAVRTYVFNGTTWGTQYLQTQGPNLDIAATIYDSNRNIVSVYNPQDRTNIDISITLSSGTYYLGIDGVGTGNPTASTPTGYTDYASLGQYVINGIVKSPGTITPPTVQVIDPNGLIKLNRTISNNKVSVDIGGVITSVNFNGTQLVSNQFADREIIAAERINGENRVLWKETSTGNMRTWLLDNSWNFVNNNNPLVSPSSAEGLLLQSQFGLGQSTLVVKSVDLITGLPTKALGPLNITSTQVFDITDPIEKTALTSGFSQQLTSTYQPIVENTLTSTIFSPEKLSLPQNQQPLIG